MTETNNTVFFPQKPMDFFFSVNLFLNGCDIDPFDISGYINVDNIDFFDKITEFGLGKLEKSISWIS